MKEFHQAMHMLLYLHNFAFGMYVAPPCHGNMFPIMCGPLLMQPIELLPKMIWV